MSDASVRLGSEGDGDPGHPVSDLPAIVGKNLRRLRIRQGHSLERLAKHSGVSRAMLGQIETGKSTPTIGLLWKVATALGVPFASLIATDDAHGPFVLRRKNAKLLSSNQGQFTSRALFPFDSERQVEFYELRLSPLHREDADAHAPGTRENLVVAKGAIELTTGTDRPIILTEGDAVLFDADVRHSYRNLGTEEAIVFLVMTYVESIG
jgi:transcriptional regulator with XRE-family HTH domain